MGKIRTFIALELPQEVKDALFALQQKFIGAIEGIRWVKPEHIHLTLKFLGSTDEERVGTIAELIERVSAGVGQFSFRVQGVGAFPNSRNPKVIWAGIQDEENKLQTYQRSLDTELALIGFSKEKRLFRPHLTLGRVKFVKAKRQLAGLLEKFQHEDMGVFTAPRVVFFKSDLRPTGPEYAELKVVHLQA